MKRRQATVVFNDISGYTSLMQTDEEKAIQIRQRHKEVVDRLTRDHNGTIIQYYGDGTLSIFNCSLDAVRCALAMQLEFKNPPEIPLRIGINAGDILLGPDGIYGDSVNIASRIERISLPGSVLVSDNVFKEIRDNADIKTKDLGRFELKNVKAPVNIHAIVNEGIRVPDAHDLAGKLGFKEKSIMVLPFFSHTKDPDDQILCDGITEQIIYALSSLEGLRVTSRTSSFTYKDKQINLKQLHQDLGLDNILEGSVRRHGNKIRITAQLINAADDFQLWSDTYSREMNDVFALQDEIASMIAMKLKAGFEESFRKRPSAPDEARNKPSNVYEFYQKGRYEWKQMQPGYLDKSISSFRNAVEIDHDFYPAWPALSKAYAYKGFYNLIPPSEALRLCQECLRQADRLDPNNIRTNIAKALFHLFYSKDDAALVEALELAALNKDHENFLLYNNILLITGMRAIIRKEPDRAIPVLRKALKFEPHNISILMELGRACLYDREHKKALDAVENILQHHPEHLPAHELKGWILFTMGQQREGIRCFEYYRKHSALPSAGLGALSFAYARTLQMKEALRMKETLLGIADDLSVPMHYELALAHLGAQEYAEMFEQLQQADHAGMPVMIFLESDPTWDEIRRFNEYKHLQKPVLAIS